MFSVCIFGCRFLPTVHWSLEGENQILYRHSGITLIWKDEIEREKVNAHWCSIASSQLFRTAPSTIEIPFWGPQIHLLWRHSSLNPRYFINIRQRLYDADCSQCRWVLQRFAGCCGSVACHCLLASLAQKHLHDGSTRCSSICHRRFVNASFYVFHVQTNALAETKIHLVSSDKGEQTVVVVAKTSHWWFYIAKIGVSNATGLPSVQLYTRASKHVLTAWQFGTKTRRKKVEIFTHGIEFRCKRRRNRYNDRTAQLASTFTARRVQTKIVNKCMRWSCSMP